METQTTYIGTPEELRGGTKGKYTWRMRVRGAWVIAPWDIHGLRRVEGQSTVIRMVYTRRFDVTPFMTLSVTYAYSVLCTDFVELGAGEMLVARHSVVKHSYLTESRSEHRVSSRLNVIISLNSSAPIIDTPTGEENRGPIGGI